MLTRLLLAATLVTGCAHASADPPGDAPSPAERGHAASGRPRLRFDLAGHLARAELRHGATLFVDLGAAGGAKHTWGGWLSNVGPDCSIDGTSAVVTVRNRARFAIPGDSRDATLSVRLRSFRPGRARVYLDEQEVAHEELSADTWTVVQTALDASALATGEHELLLRFDRGADLPGVPRAYLAVDWIALGDETVEGAPAREGDALAIGDGWSAGYAMEVPDAARLRGVVEGAGALEVWAHTDGAAARRLARVEGGSSPRRFDVDLAPLAGDVARIDLRAAGGEVRLPHAAVVTLDREPPPSASRPHNVLLYLIDTLRADRLRAYAPDTRVRTPGLSRFAAGATVLTGAHSQENWTKPSVATLLSSLMPWEHTAYSDGSVVPSSVRLLPQMLGERGFATAGFVANGYVSNRFGFRRGWDAWRNYIREGESTRGERVAADVMHWLDERPAEQPFFLYVHAIDPHVPYRPPARFLQMYDPDPYRGPVDFSHDATLLERVKTGGLRLGARDRAHLEALYDGEVSYQDAQLASILDGLERRGLADDTLVVVTADHGEEFWDHGSVGHGHNLYEELVHVPLIVRAPGLPPARMDGPVGLVDVVPTVLDALGEPVPEGLSGRSLWPRLRGAGEDAPRAAVAGFMEHWRSVVSGRFKLIARSRGRIAVYDLEQDPGEQHDVAAERPLVTAYLRGLLGLELAGSDAVTPRPRRRHRASSATIDPELQSQLEALGYVGSSRPN